MDIRKVEYFIKLAETLNYSKTAQELHITHQTLSKQIQLLENECGAKLLERSTTKVSLTEIGKKMYDIFKPIIREIHRGTHELEEFVKYKKDTLRIGYFSILSYSRIVEPVIEKIQFQNPNLRIDLLATDIDLVKQLLEQDSIDLAIAPKFGNEWDELPHVELKQEPLQVIVAEKHPWYSKEKITLEDMREERMLVYQNRPIEGKQSFFHELQVKERVPVRNADSYMNTLRRGEYFGIIGENYSRREGKYRLLELPESLQKNYPLVAAFKRLHPMVKQMQALEGLLSNEKN